MDESRIVRELHNKRFANISGVLMRDLERVGAEAERYSRFTNKSLALEHIGNTVFLNMEGGTLEHSVVQAVLASEQEQNA